MPVDVSAGVSQHREMFEVFREVHKVRNFRLVLCVEAQWDRTGMSYEVIKRIIAAEQAAGGFDYLSSHPLVVRTG